MASIENLFEKLAFTTWDAIENAFGNRISFGEDAITSINLLTLKNASFPTIAIEDTRPSESTKGCDFEFWISKSRLAKFPAQNPRNMEGQKNILQIPAEPETP